MKKNDIYFFEKQRFRQWWVWLILIGVNVLCIIGCILQIGLKRPFGDNPVSDTGLIIITVVLFMVTVVLLSCALQTYINEEGVFVRYFPFQFRYKFYNWNTIRASYVRKYSPVREYGGWGVRVGFNATKAYTMSGNIGLQLILQNGKKVLIGTNRPDHLKRVLMKLDKMERVKDG